MTNTISLKLIRAILLASTNEMDMFSCITDYTLSGKTIQGYQEAFIIENTKIAVLRNIIT